MEAYTDVIVTFNNLKVTNLPAWKKNNVNSPQLKVNWKDGKEISSNVLSNSINPFWEHFPEVVLPDITVKVFL